MGNFHATLQMIYIMYYKLATDTYSECKVYRAVVLSSLLYGAETWTVYRTHVKKLSAFIMRQLRDIMAVKWYDKITNEAILRCAKDGADILIEKNPR